MMSLSESLAPEPAFYSTLRWTVPLTHVSLGKRGPLCVGLVVCEIDFGDGIPVGFKCPVSINEFKSSSDKYAQEIRTAVTSMRRCIEEHYRVTQDLREVSCASSPSSPPLC